MDKLYSDIQHTVRCHTNTEQFNIILIMMLNCSVLVWHLTCIQQWNQLQGMTEVFIKLNHLYFQLVLHSTSQHICVHVWCRFPCYISLLVITYRQCFCCLCWVKCLCLSSCVCGILLCYHTPASRFPVVFLRSPSTHPHKHSSGDYISGLVQDCGVSIVLALKIPQSSTKALVWHIFCWGSGLSLKLFSYCSFMP